ncbi:MAG TPA: NAD(P)H-binding protein [Salinimicrobium sp.]|nr:NAD(P)H-binding protein [Salinimicrobium sp.]
MQHTGKILIAGATGALGMEIIKQLHQKNLPMRALTRSAKDNIELDQLTGDVFVGDAAKNEIDGATSGISTVISALGKSVSLFTPTEESFFESDFLANKNILDDAIKNGVKRFIYVSIKGADTGYTIAQAHKMFEDALRESGIEYTIIRPVGFFSGLNDLAILAKRKVIPIVGDGHARTNSIHHKDLAKAVVSFLDEGPEMIEVGGPKIHTRLEMAKMVEEKIGGKVVKVPEVFADFGVELQKIFSEDIYNKLDYFKFVTTNDMIAEPFGSITFREYLDSLDLEKLP